MRREFKLSNPDLERVRAIYRMSTDGTPVDLLTDTYGISASQVLMAYRDGAVIYRYENGDELEDIAEEFNITSKYIGSIRRKYGVEANRRDATALDEDKIIDYYEKGRSGPWIAKKYDVSVDRVYRILHNSEVLIDPSRYRLPLNEEFFDDINSERSAYWLGFMYADGYVNPNSNRIELKLKRGDRSHLEKFCNDIGFGGSIYDIEVELNGNIYQQSVVSLSSNKMQQGLMLWGCRPNKSFNLTPPSLPDNLIRHFIRGFWDGDGHLGFNGKYPRMNLVGTHEMLSWVVDVSPMAHSRVVPSKSIWCIYTSRLDIPAVAKWLYDDCTVVLDRKKQVADEIMRRANG